MQLSGTGGDFVIDPVHVLSIPSGQVRSGQSDPIRFGPIRSDPANKMFTLLCPIFPRDTENADCRLCRPAVK